MTTNTRRADLTYDDVDRACDAILARGEAPGPRNVHRELENRGSLSTIIAFLNRWNENRLQAIQCAALAVSKEFQASINRELLRIKDTVEIELKNQLDLEREISKESLRQNEELLAELQALSGELNDQVRGSDRKIASLETKLASAAEKVSLLESELAIARTEQLNSDKRATTADLQTTHLQENMLNLRSELNAVGTAHEKLQNSHNNLQDRHQHIACQLAAAEAKVESLSSDKADLLSRLELAHAESDRLKQETVSLRVEVAELSRSGNKASKPHSKSAPRNKSPLPAQTASQSS